MQAQLGRRLTWLSVVALLLLSAMGGRLYQLQVTRNALYTQRVYQYRPPLLLDLAEKRGLILDRNGEPLTDPRQSWRVGVFPQLLSDPAAEAQTLGRILGEEPLDLELAFYQLKKEGWLPLSSPVDEAEAKAIGEAHLPGIAAGPYLKRQGPNALARHLLGYTNDNGGTRGLELVFNEQLKGGDVPRLAAYLDGRGEPLSGLGIRAVVPTAGKEPYQLYTTIDRRIQAAVEEVLGARRDSLPATAVVMNPSTGEVLAMASRPNFPYPFTGDPNDESLRNRAVEQQPPGSVFKAVIAAAALEQGKVKPDERFYCDGHETFQGWNVSDAGHGWLTFSEAVAKSCNIVFAKVGVERLGVAGMAAAAQKFGFGQVTNVLGHPWDEEHPGKVPAPTAGTAVQMAIGQGDLRVTPLQIARAYSAIANGGVLPAARLIQAVKSPAGEVVERPQAGRPERVISKEAAAALQRLLAGVTEPGGSGTGRAAWVTGAGSAGKTGSAETGKKGVVHAWFAGYLPQWKPKWVVVVLVEDGQFGGTAAAPVFAEIGKRLVAIEGY
ncbi:MAG TPA: penicillin-binding protein 2 [Symbiobacteriaceae bacterium]|nr:penicillin-binding protein 2 [Symbiobacteriaceae bacterium]